MKLQVIDNRGEVLIMRAGGPLEIDLIKGITEALVQRQAEATVGTAAMRRRMVELAVQAAVARGVGVWRTEAHVKHAIEMGLTEALTVLRGDVTDELEPEVESAVASVVLRLKQRVAGAI